MPGWLDWVPRKVLLFFWKHNHLGGKPELLCLSCSNSCCVQHHTRTGKAMLLNCNYLSKMRAGLKSATGRGKGPEQTFLPSIGEALYSTSTPARGSHQSHLSMWFTCLFLFTCLFYTKWKLPLMELYLKIVSEES